MADLASGLARLLLPAAAVALFFLLSLVTVRVARPTQPRKFFLAYAIVLLGLTTYVYLRWWPIGSTEDAAGLVACDLLQALACLTMWNTFYSVLWGFSGGLMHDLYTDPALGRVEAIVAVYDRADGLDRILARRMPNLEAGGYLTMRDGVLRLQPKGRLIALGTIASFKVFSLGMGGGIK